MNDVQFKQSYICLSLKNYLIFIFVFSYFVDIPGSVLFIKGLFCCGFGHITNLLSIVVYLFANYFLFEKGIGIANKVEIFIAN